jgi:hypothetical protein
LSEHSDAEIRQQIHDLEWAQRLSPDPHTARVLQAWKDAARLREGDLREGDLFPHSIYWFGGEKVRGALMHESGHWVHDQMLHADRATFRYQLESLRQMYDRRSIVMSQQAQFDREKAGMALTERGLDNFQEAMAENWTAYTLGRTHMMDPSWVVLFDGWAGQEAAKGGPGSGNWAHESVTRVGKVGGSDPGGGLSAIGIGYGSTPEQRREMAARYREARVQAPVYEPFSSVREARRWLGANYAWIGTIRYQTSGHMPTTSYVQGLSGEEIIEMASTLRQMKDMSPDARRYAVRGVLFNRAGDNSYYREQREERAGFWSVPAQASRIEIGLTSSHSDTYVQSQIAKLEMSIEYGGANPYNTAQLARWKELQTFMRDGRWKETYPHAKYMFGNQQTRASLVHESGHWIQDQIEHGAMFSHAQTRILEQRYSSSLEERRRIGVTQRGMDTFQEAFAESWSVYVAGKRHMLDPDMATVFDVWTGQRAWEDAWPQYAKPA